MHRAPAGSAPRRLIAAFVIALAVASAVAHRSGALIPPVPTPTPYVPRCDFAPTPNAGPPGTGVSVVGICYPIHSGRPGAIFFDDTLVARIRGETGGDYAAVFTVPANATVGSHQLTIQYGPDGGSIITSAIFTVLPFCRGDCDDNGRVTVDELLRGVDIALGKLDSEACAPIDLDHDGTITISEIMAAVGDALTGCIVAFTPTPTPSDTPTPVALGGPCRATAECEQPELLCLEPGGFAGCVECRLENDHCAADPDCAAAGAGMVCEQSSMLGPDCFCRPTRRCIPGCTSDAECSAGQRCSPNAHCQAVTCAADHDCAKYFDCQLFSGHCVRRSCGADSDCPTGFCVENGCHGALGTCVARPGATALSAP